MASLNKCMIIGNVCKDIEVKYTQSGQAVVSTTIATNEKIKDKSGDYVDKAEFHNVTFWGKLAEIVGEYVAKGSLIYVEGRIQTRKWQDKDGNDRYTTDIVAEKMQMLGGKQSSGGASHRDSEPQRDLSVPFDEDSIPFNAG